MRDQYAKLKYKEQKIAKLSLELRNKNDEIQKK